jgi:hypothetical protein
VWHDAWFCEIRSHFVLLTANVTFIYLINIFEGVGEQIAAESSGRQERNKRRLENDYKIDCFIIYTVCYYCH